MTIMANIVKCEGEEGRAGHLTTEHSASAHGIPVFVCTDGEVWTHQALWITHRKIEVLSPDRPTVEQYPDWAGLLA